MEWEIRQIIKQKQKFNHSVTLKDIVNGCMFVAYNNLVYVFKKKYGNKNIRWKRYQILHGHFNHVSNLIKLPDNTVLSYEKDGHVFVWKQSESTLLWEISQELAKPIDKSKKIVIPIICDRFTILRDGSLVSFSNHPNQRLQIWKQNAVFEWICIQVIQSDILCEIIPLQDGTFVTRSMKGDLSFWRKHDSFELITQTQIFKRQVKMDYLYHNMRVMELLDNSIIVTTGKNNTYVLKKRKNEWIHHQKLEFPKRVRLFNLQEITNLLDGTILIGIDINTYYIFKKNKNGIWENDQKIKTPTLKCIFTRILVVTSNMFYLVGGSIILFYEKRDNWVHVNTITSNMDISSIQKLSDGDIVVRGSNKKGQNVWILKNSELVKKWNARKHILYALYLWHL